MAIKLLNLVRGDHPLLMAFLFLFACQICIGQEYREQDLSDLVPEELIVYQDSQILYNGKVWHREYSNIIGNEFLFSAVWFGGDVVTENQTFRNRMLRYDIVSDELLIRRPDGVVIVLNSETTREFTLTHDNAQYRFLNLGISANSSLKGYANLLYEGKCNLLLKTVKEISPLGYRNAFDIFTQTEYLLVMKDGEPIRLRGRRGLLDFLSDRRDELKKFMRQHNTIIMPKQPGSVIPVLVYYNSLAD